MFGEAWRQTWAAVLDELEGDVTEVEELLANDHRMRDHEITNAWKPPQALGPLPLDMKPRADAILARQIAAARAVTMALATNRQHANLANRIETGGRAAPRPAYIDCAM